MDRRQNSLAARTGRRERGAGVAEFALLLPVFCLLIIGIVDFGRLVFAYSTLTHAAGAAARYASVHSTTSVNPATESDVARHAREAAQTLDADAIAVMTIWSPANVPGGTVRVQMDLDVELLTPLPLKTPLRLSGSAEMRISS